MRRAAGLLDFLRVIAPRAAGRARRVKDDSVKEGGRIGGGEESQGSGESVRDWTELKGESGRIGFCLIKVMSHRQLDRLGRSPLHYAAGNGDSAKVTDRLQAGDDVNLADKNGWTPLHFAAQATSAPVIRLLLAANATVDAGDSHGNTPLSNAVFNYRGGDGDAIQVLRQAGADPYRANNHGVSPVSLARQIANYDVARFFADLPDDPKGAA
jgi:hypothetical protein